VPFEPHKALYEKLRDINRRVNEVLEKTEYDALPDLLRTQERLVNRLRAAGTCEDVGLLPFLTETRDQLADTALVLQRHRMDLAGRLKAMGIKRKLAGAYGRVRG
jgi:hypothetical protein